MFTISQLQDNVNLVACQLTAKRERKERAMGCGSDDTVVAVYVLGMLLLFLLDVLEYGWDWDLVIALVFVAVVTLLLCIML